MGGPSMYYFVSPVQKIGLDLGSGFGACLERGLGLGLELDNYNALCLVCLGKFHCVFS